MSEFKFRTFKADNIKATKFNPLDTYIDRFLDDFENHGNNAMGFEEGTAETQKIAVRMRSAYRSELKRLGVKVRNISVTRAHRKYRDQGMRSILLLVPINEPEEEEDQSEDYTQTELI